MRMKNIKNTELNVSVFCLGGQEWGSRDDKTTSYAMLDQYIEYGGNFLDTANNYAIWNGHGGESETLLGDWLADRGNRSDVVIATKMGGRAKDAPMSSAPEHIRRECERSLKRLRTDYIDLYYFHCDDRKVPLEDQLGTMQELIEEGKIRHVGASNFKAWRLAEAAVISEFKKYCNFSAVQQRYTYLRPRVDADFGFQKSTNDDLLEYCDERGLQLIAYSPLLRGAYIREDRPLAAQYRHPDSESRMTTLLEIAQELHLTANQVVLAWMIGRGVIVISGASKKEQLDESFKGFDIDLSDETLDRLDNAGSE
ncbi:MAG: aldo/keto reductase [Gammaproteobacteria bacterium TMED1]|nr:MAG: aldo/keto reductase [Gammaproteobacteria bacterium TMED1]